jgi:hypothetical protein
MLEDSTEAGKEADRVKRAVRECGVFVLKATSLWLWGKLLSAIMPPLLAHGAWTLIHVSDWLRVHG